MPLSSSDTDSNPPPKVVILGGGLAGLVLALALKKHVSLLAEVYEQAPGFADGTGGAIGMYPNGLRVLRDIDPDLLRAVRDVGYPYIYRRWMRHDGTEVALAKENVLTTEEELESIGIRRWKLQKVLYDATISSGIPVHFSKHISSVKQKEDGTVECTVADGTIILADYVFGADGVKSKVREAVVGSFDYNPQYTGVTCLMGAANVSRPIRGICFPSSASTKCHACTYPTSENEQVFQIYFPTPTENPESWGTLSDDEGRKECSALAERLEKDGWHNQFVEPLRCPKAVVRVGLRARDSPPDRWVDGPVVLLGDAAHPPVPYIGQGAQMAIEDAGIIALLLKRLCIDTNRSFVREKFAMAMEMYEQLRIPRTRNILMASKTLGKTQQDRADSWMYNLAREWSIKFQVMIHGTLPVMMPGAQYDYREDVNKMLAQVT